MNQRILIVCPILPRLPIRLVLFGLSLRDTRTRKKFSYKPLALFFRRAREHAAELIHPTRYASQDGTNITVAPRFEFTIYLASNLRLLADYQQILGQQNWNESNNVSTILSPLIVRNFQGLVKSNESQSDHIKKPFTRSLLKRQRIPTSSTPAGFRMPCCQLNSTVVFRKLFDHDRGGVSLAATSKFHQEERLIPKEAGFGWGLHRKNHLLGAALTDNYPILTLKPEETLINSPSKMRCKTDRAEETKHIIAIGEFLSTTQHRKSLVQAINQRFPEFLSSAINKVVRQTTTSLTQQNIGKFDEVYSREDSHSRNFLATQISVSKKGKYLSLISEFHEASQFVSKETNIGRKLHRKNRLLEAASTADYSILVYRPQFLSGPVSIGKLNKIYPKADFPFIRSLTPSIFTFKDAKPPGSIESLDFPLPGRQSVGQRELGGFQEKLISPTSLDYRVEKKIPSVSAATVTESTSLPVSTPKIDIDRLSRDVWNQIEKRIRIERERRGRL